MRVTNLETFLEKAKKIHSNEDGSAIYDYNSFVYATATTKSAIICKMHGEFMQTPSKHCTGQGCKKCGIERRADLRRSTLEDFINRAKTMPEHTKCSYDKVVYAGSDKHVIITCDDHGDFEQTASQHLSGSSCPKCAGKIRKTTQDFIEKACILHMNRYLYNAVEYVNSSTNVIIGCLEHGDFAQTPGHHLSGQGCPKCANSFPYTTETFIEKANKIHSHADYDYSTSIYEGIHKPITIKCNIHGEFIQSAHSHLCGCGCPACGRQKTINGKKLNTQQFVARAQAIHEDRWDYSKTEYTLAKLNILVICKDHGEFTITPDYHLSGGICPKCVVRSPYSKAACKWLYALQETIPDLEWAFNGGEHKIKDSNYRADGYSPITNTIYEFHGCFWHGCTCKEQYAKTDHDMQMHLERRAKTNEREEFIRSKGYNLVVVWEHETKQFTK